MHTNHTSIDPRKASVSREFLVAQIALADVVYKSVSQAEALAKLLHISIEHMTEQLQGHPLVQLSADFSTTVAIIGERLEKALEVISEIELELGIRVQS